jgi:type II secretory pathway pseudopilin PulG
MFKKKVKGQIWVETAIYTLIGLTLISIILSVAIPQVQKIKDRSIITQTSDSLLQLNDQIHEVSDVAGNIRVFYFSFEKGTLLINSTSDRIMYELEDTNYKFSEPGQIVPYGAITYKTVAHGKKYVITLDIDYNATLDITYKKTNENKLLHPGIYKIKMENVGDNPAGQPIHLDFDLV